MDTILIVLALSPKALLASEIGPIVGRSDQAVRKTLAALSSAGLAVGRQVGTRGPVGTFAWQPTTEGVQAVSQTLSWLRRESTLRQAAK